jgi:hypothetical protein
LKGERPLREAEARLNGGPLPERHVTAIGLEKGSDLLTRAEKILSPRGASQTELHSEIGEPK